MSSSPRPSTDASTPQAKARRRGGRVWLPALAAAVSLLALYAAFGFWLAPGIIRDQVVTQVAQRYHRTARLGEVRLNPFTLRLEARRFALPDADGQPMLGFDRLVVQVSPASLWRGGVAFREISLDAPTLRLVRRVNGRLNLEDLIPRPSGKPKPSAQPAKIMVDHLAVRGGDIDLYDLERAAPFVEGFDAVSFTLDDFSTVKDGAGYALKAVTERGERLAWHGQFGLSPLASRGVFAVSDVKLAPLAALAGDALPFGVTGGTLDASGGYNFGLDGERLTLAVDVGAARLTNAGLRARGADVDWVALPSVGVAKVHVDVPARSVSVGAIAAAGPTVDAWTEPGGAINLARFAPRSPTAPQAGAAPATPGPAWSIALPSLTVTDGRVAFEDRSGSRPVKVVMTPVNVAVAGFAFPITKPVQVQASLGLDDGGGASAQGTVSLDHLSADLDVTASDIGLTRLQPYIDRAAHLRLLSGRFSGKGHLAYAADGGAAFNGDLNVDGLHTVDKSLNQDFINWRALQFQDVSAQTRPLAIKVRQVVAQQPYARVVIGPNYVTNISAVLGGAPAPASQPEAAAPAQPSSAAPPPPTVEPIATPPAEAPSVPPPPPAAPRQALPVEIGKVLVKNGRMDFTDLTVKPHFAAGIQDLAGTIKGLSGRQDARADVDLAGQVDRYSPVTINGKVNYFAARSFTDLKMSFQNMELTTFSPYSGKFAGYRIDKGKMSVDLHYLIDDQKLDATHHLVINQLQLGDKVDSADAVNLPVKLIIALLKDRNGVIDLPIEVTGALNDPHFRLWPLIWKVVENLLVKVVTSPFALLGHLVGGGDELSYVDFTPGSAVIDDAGRQKLATLAKALVERPAVNLDVPMSVDPALDRPALIDAKFSAELAAAAKAQLGKHAAEPGAAGTALAAPRSHRKVLEALYREQFGKKPDIPKPAAAVGGPKPDADQAAVAWLETALRARVTVTDQDLVQLGRARADAVQAVVLGDGQINPSRVFVITEPPKDAPQVRMTLSLS